VTFCRAGSRVLASCACEECFRGRSSLRKSKHLPAIAQGVFRVKQRAATPSRFHRQAKGTCPSNKDRSGSADLGFLASSFNSLTSGFQSSTSSTLPARTSRLRPAAVPPYCTLHPNSKVPRKTKSTRRIRSLTHCMPSKTSQLRFPPHQPSNISS
jgi:hypothetical protein